MMKYVGGKYRVLDLLYSYFPQHYTYAEPFGGSYQVLLNKTPSTLEFINDIDPKITSLAYCFLLCPKELIQAANFDLHSQGLFKFLKEFDFLHATMLEQALNKLYIIYHSFGSLGNNYAYMLNQKRHIHIKHTKESIMAIHERLKNVQICSEDFKIFLRKFSKVENGFIYLDPPYIISDEKKYYDYNFTKEDHAQLVTILSGFNPKNVKWLLSYDKQPVIEELYSNFNIIDFNIPYSISREKRDVTPELLISNYDITKMEKPKSTKLEKFFTQEEITEIES